MGKGYDLIWMFPKIVGFPPKSSNLIGFSIINHPFWGTPIFGNTHIQNSIQMVFFFAGSKGDEKFQQKPGTKLSEISKDVLKIYVASPQKCFFCPHHAEPFNCRFL